MKKLGFGLMRLPLKNKEDLTDIDYAHLSEMVDRFLEGGFSYFDTAYPYHKGLSETAARKALVERHPRESFLLADKMPTFIVEKSDDYQRIFDEQLEKCGVEYFDYYLLHNLGVLTYENSLKNGGFEFIQKLKEEGRAKRIGFSFHDKAELLDEILTAHPCVEFVQLQINYVDWEDSVIQSRKCYETARKHGKEIIIMEPVKGGALANLPEDAENVLKEVNPNASPASWAMRYAESFEGVSVVLSGMTEMSQLEDNMKTSDSFRQLNADEMRAIEQAGEIIRATTAISCTACQYCVDDCPKNIPIPSYFGMFNQAKKYNNNLIQSIYYKNLAGAEGVGSASECIECGLCEDHCPQHLPIIEHLKELHKLFESVER
ncbi:aldo/keto reductase [Denitrovibrio acetiphilus DSM 12809]|uniref:Aldo/keto reductase n=1 Tax=Denitrovibrio acetiphilus (strain DSM 12809 / NBRC 114555 / N2460) TaxID=522772 RepID=D4H285_DENA2|nr:aldo/keto reductase [Denitrovibrio acetiphilus]ADD68876.1 aldo/keto reductase [Denitrovibrio acetiphilus DSM 12809]